MTSTTRVSFQGVDAEFCCVDIVRSGRAPVIASLHRALLALGMVVDSYRARLERTSLRERMVLVQRDGEPLPAALRQATQAAVLRVVAEVDAARLAAEPGISPHCGRERAEGAGELVPDAA